VYLSSRRAANAAGTRREGEKQREKREDEVRR